MYMCAFIKIFLNLFDLSKIIDSLNNLQLNSVWNKLNLNTIANITLHDYINVDDDFK